jgi:hypothetical protein
VLFRATSLVSQEDDQKFEKISTIDVGEMR